MDNGRWSWSVIRAVSPVLVAFSVTAPRSWHVVPGLLAMTALLLNRGALGFAAAVVLQMAILYRHGVTAFLLLAGLWMVWLPRSYAVWGALVFFLAGGILTQVTVAWASAAAVSLVLLVEKVRCYMKRRARKQMGQSLVEFAMILPILLLVILGIVELGRVFVQYIGLSQVTESVAQAASRLGGYHPDLDAVVDSQIYSFMDAGNLTYRVDTSDSPSGTLSCSTGTCQCQYGQYVWVEAVYPTQASFLFWEAHVDLEVTNVHHCWRGGAP